MLTRQHQTQNAPPKEAEKSTEKTKQKQKVRTPTKSNVPKLAEIEKQTNECAQTGTQNPQ